MTVYYYNGLPIVTPFTIASNHPVFSNDTLSLKHVRASQGVQRWELSFNILQGTNLADFLINSIEEITTVNSMIMPQLNEVNDATTITGTITASAAVGSTTVTINTTAASGFLPKGSFISFSGTNDKVYLLKTDITGNSSTSCEIYPGLFEAAATDNLNYGSAVNFTYYKETSTLSGLTFKDGILANAGKITLIEAIT